MKLHPKVWPALAAVVAGLNALPLLAAPPKEPVPVTRQAVDELVARYVDRLWKSQNVEGHWDTPNWKPTAPLKPTDPRRLHGNRGGSTALVLLALKSAGADPQDPRFVKALQWLNEQPWQGTYFRGLRATLYGQLGGKYQPLCHEDAKLLLRSIASTGVYSYNPPLGPQEKATAGDLSNTQYGILGVWSASDSNFEVPQGYWRLVEKCYIAAQCADGGGGYHLAGGKNGYGSMTVAALATEFVIWEKLYLLDDKDCRGRVNKDLLKAIDRGMGWMARNFSAINNPRPGGVSNRNNFFYYCYGIERVGVASGYKYFGEHDWYKEITYNIVNGKIGPAGNNEIAWAVLFLSYGRAPVAVNKLQFGEDWNNHPRDYAMLCRYLSRRYERHYNWQIMPLTAGQDEFHDAPILALSGKKRFTMTDAEAGKIRTYLDRGGLLFCEAIDDSFEFVQSVRRLCQQMYPSFELTRLDAEHPIHTLGISKVTGQPSELLGLSDGVRTMVVVSPKELGCDWQRLNIFNGRSSFRIGEGLVNYASDRGQLWSKEESYWPTDKGLKPGRTVTVGRLVHGDAKAEHVWNPSGGAGWQRVDLLSRNAGGPAVVTTAVDFSQPVEPAQVPVVHVTGIGEIKLSEAARANLKRYVANGGLLLADAAGGKKAFVASFTKLCDELFGPGRLVPPPTLPFVKPATDENGRLWYRHVNEMPRVLRPLELLAVNVEQADGGTAWNVILLPHDLTYALNGAPAFDMSGADPASADTLVRAILDWRTTPAPPGP